jgi:hypothetical protein
VPERAGCAARARLGCCWRVRREVAVAESASVPHWANHHPARQWSPAVTDRVGIARTGRRWRDGTDAREVPQAVWPVGGRDGRGPAAWRRARPPPGCPAIHGSGGCSYHLRSLRMRPRCRRRLRQRRPARPRAGGSRAGVQADAGRTRSRTTPAHPRMVANANSTTVLPWRGSLPPTRSERPPSALWPGPGSPGWCRS